MFRDLWDPAALESSMNKSIDRENDGLDTVRDVLDATMGETLRGMKDQVSDNFYEKGRNLIKDFNGAVGKSSGNQARTTTQAGYTIDAS